MKVLPVNSVCSVVSGHNNSSFKAKITATKEAQTQAYTYLRDYPNMAYLLFNDSLNKLNALIKDQYPLGETVSLDVAKQGKQVLKNNNGVQYEMRIGEKTINYYFDFGYILREPSYYGKTKKEKIDIESTRQANYLYQAFDYLRNLK